MRFIAKWARFAPLVLPALTLRHNICLEPSIPIEPLLPPEQPLIQKQATFPITEQDKVAAETSEKPVENSEEQGQTIQEQSQSKAVEVKPQRQIEVQHIKAESTPEVVVIEAIQPQPQEEKTKIQPAEKEIENGEARVAKDCPQQAISYLKALGYNITISQTTPNHLTIKNKQGQIKHFHWQPNTPPELKPLCNFLHPPTTVNSPEELTQLISSLSPQDYLIAAYLPTQQDYDRLPQYQPRSPFDTYTSKHKIDVSAAETAFKELALQAGSNRQCYAIIRDRSAAQLLNINPWKAGEPHLLHNSPSDSNWLWQGKKFRLQNIAKQCSSNSQCVNHMAHAYLNKLQSEVELEDTLQQMRLSHDKRKLLLFYSDEPRQIFHQQTDALLDKVAHIHRQDVLVIKTTNLQLLRKKLHIQPDNFATVRIIDPNRTQPSLFPGNSSQHFSRTKMRGAFKLENICESIVSKQWVEHYESKKGLIGVKAVSSQELTQLDGTLVLIEKEGCQGCHYLLESLDELKKAINMLRQGGRIARQAIYRYQIQDAQNLSNLHVRRCSIYSESLDFNPPSTTPRLYLLRQGQAIDLHAEQSIQKLQQVRNQTEAALVHDAILSDIIERIRQAAQ